MFNSSAWKSEGIKTYPNNFLVVDSTSEYIRVTAVPSGKGADVNSVSGVFIVDIFVSAGNGPKQTSFIADKLDEYLVGKSLSTSAGGVTQFQNSSLQFNGQDKDTPTLYRSTYTIPFNYFGAS